MNNLKIRELYEELFHCSCYSLSEEEIVTSILAYYGARNKYFKDIEEAIKYREDEKNHFIYFHLF